MKTFTNGDCPKEYTQLVGGLQGNGEDGVYTQNYEIVPPALSLLHSAFKKGTQEYCVEINGADVTNAKVGTALSKMGGTHLASGGCQAGNRTAAITKSAFGNTFTLFLV